jgi:hypothetical protein
VKDLHDKGAERRLQEANKECRNECNDAECFSESGTKDHRREDLSVSVRIATDRLKSLTDEYSETDPDTNDALLDTTRQRDGMRNAADSASGNHI